MPQDVHVGGATGQELAAVQILHAANGAEPETLDPHRADGRDRVQCAARPLRGTHHRGARRQPHSRRRRELDDQRRRTGLHLPPAARRPVEQRRSRDGRGFRLRPPAQCRSGHAVGVLRDPLPARECRSRGQRQRCRRNDSVCAPSTTRTLEIRLHSPTPYLLGLLTHSSTYPVHRPSLQKYGDRFARPGNLVSNGAFRLNDWVVQSHIQLVRNPHYWENANTITRRGLVLPRRECRVGAEPLPRE